jgi:hypothetical protein
MFHCASRQVKPTDSFSKRHDFRTRQDRVERRMQEWRTQLPDLVDAFLAYKAHGPRVSGFEDSGQWQIEVINIESTYPVQMVAKYLPP